MLAATAAIRGGASSFSASLASLLAVGAAANTTKLVGCAVDVWIDWVGSLFGEWVAWCLVGWLSQLVLVVMVVLMIDLIRLMVVMVVMVFNSGCEQ